MLTVHVVVIRGYIPFIIYYLYRQYVRPVLMKLASSLKERALLSNIVLLLKSDRLLDLSTVL